MAGPGTVTGIRPSDTFDRSDGSSAPNHEQEGLWDTLTIDVSPFISSGDVTATAGIAEVGDCLIYVAQVLGIETGDTCGNRGVNYINFV